LYECEKEEEGKNVQYGEFARPFDRVDREEGKKRKGNDEERNSSEVEASEDKQAVPSTYCRHLLAVCLRLPSHAMHPNDQVGWVVVRRR